MSANEMRKLMEAVTLNEKAEYAEAWFETDSGFDVKATVAYYGGRPGRSHMPNGDPGYPAEDAEVEVYDTFLDGRPYKPTDDEQARWEADVLENPENYFRSPEDEH